MMADNVLGRPIDQSVGGLVARCFQWLAIRTAIVFQMMWYGLWLGKREYNYYIVPVYNLHFCRLGFLPFTYRSMNMHLDDSFCPSSWPLLEEVCN